MKICNTCSIEKELTEYKKDPRNKSGLQGICKECNKKWQQKRRGERHLGIIPLVSIEEKRCNKCALTKPILEFYKDAGCADGHSTLCKVCRNESMAKWRNNNRNKYNANMRKLRATDRDWAKDTDLRRCYGIGLEQYNAMLEAQNHVCKICKKSQVGVRPLVVDHHHESGEVRGLLCYSCNRKIVLLDAPKEEQDAAKAYIESRKLKA